tara:strand:- start:2050 stop:3204 length:1155 start_codon:yes stop_codon:yes gene_type:complete
MVKEHDNDLISRFTYNQPYIKDIDTFKKEILNKTYIPHQVEVQPGPKGKALCWLQCPYCYGGSAKNTGELLNDDRYIEVLKEIAIGGVKKIIFAGYATDPLNYKFIDNLVQVPLDYKQVMGFHTKAIKVSDRLIRLITNSELTPKSYFSTSVDAGSNETYNIVHGLPPQQGKIYEKVKKNLKKIILARNKSTSHLDVSATFLINSLNGNVSEVKNFIRDFKNIGVDAVRFTFPQSPRGYNQKTSDDPNIPNREEKDILKIELKELIEKENSSYYRVVFIDNDEILGIDDKERTLPCFSRWVFPSIGYDGYLSHCSESAAPHFRDMAIGNLNNQNFWSLYYDYDPEKINELIINQSQKMTKLDCRCDRKEHATNQFVKKSKIFPF